jgi:hypothetical protein
VLKSPPDLARKRRQLTQANTSESRV